MKIAKIRDTRTPNRANSGDAGIDFFIPNDFKQTHLSPNESILIPSGIKAKVPVGYMLTAFNKSGVATKKKLITGACIVDSSYMGEIHIHLINVGTEIQILSAGDKIVQFILVPVLEDIIEVVSSEEELFGGVITERGEGGFGSTGVK